MRSTLIEVYFLKLEIAKFSMYKHVHSLNIVNIPITGWRKKLSYSRFLANLFLKEATEIDFSVTSLDIWDKLIFPFSVAKVVN